MNELATIIGLLAGLNTIVLVPIFNFVKNVEKRLTRIEAKLNIDE